MSESEEGGSADKSVDPTDLDTFVQAARKFGPAEAQRRLTRLGIAVDKVQKLRAAYDAEAIRLVVLRNPPSLDRAHEQPWYLGPSDDDRFWPAILTMRDKEHWVEEDLKNLEQASTKVVARLRHPRTP